MVSPSKWMHSNKISILHRFLNILICNCRSLAKGLKETRTRRRGQRRLEKWFYIYLLSTNLVPLSFTEHQNYHETESGTRRNIQYKNNKINRRVSRSLDNVEFGHFLALICRRRQRNVPRIITHVHSHCSVLWTFCLGTFPLPLPSWFLNSLINILIAEENAYYIDVLVHIENFLRKLSRR